MVVEVVEVIMLLEKQEDLEVELDQVVQVVHHPVEQEIL